MISIGISGWSNSAFLDKFYKQKLTSLDQLKFYARKFQTVEINYSFYHVPKPETFKKWKDATPVEFVFAVKLNRQFTHIDKLNLSAESLEKLKVFLSNAGTLKEKLAVILIQTPSSLKYDLNVLKKFLSEITEILKGLDHIPRLSFEFRNEAWLNDSVFALLENFHAGVVIAQSARYPQTKKVLSDLIYLRLHGPDKLFDSEYSSTELKDWSTFLQQHPKSQIYVYFNNTMHGQAIDNALSLQSLIT